MSETTPLPSFPTGGTEHEATVAAHPYASWGRRAAAYLLDGLIVAVAALLLTRVTGHTEPWSIFHFRTVNGHRRLVPYGRKLVFWSISAPIIAFLYSVGLLASSWRATLGMRLVGIELARAEDLGRCGLGQVCGRSAIVVALSVVSSLAGILGLLLVLVDFLWPIWDARNQTIHDKLARTVVLRTAPG